MRCIKHLDTERAGYIGCGDFFHSYSGSFQQLLELQMLSTNYSFLQQGNSFIVESSVAKQTKSIGTGLNRRKKMQNIDLVANNN